MKNPARLAWQRLGAWTEAATARLSHAFVEGWGRIERGYRRPSARLALRLGFVFYPILTLITLAGLSWDWTHERHLASAENAVFDLVINWRPLEPKPSGKVVVVEIDQCSIDYFRARGEGGWPWPRSRHADLLDALDRAGVRAVGYDVLFADRSPNDPQSDAILEAMAEGGQGRFVFASARLRPDFDRGAPLRVSQAPSAFPLTEHPHADPRIALMLPYGPAMRRNAALVNVSRGEDGMLRDVPLRESLGDWAIPALALRLVVGPHPAAMAHYPARIRVDWRNRSQLPMISAANVLAHKPVCRSDVHTAPNLKGTTVLVGYTAAGLNDAKPTPVNLSMAGVMVQAEAVEGLLTGTTIWMPPASLKYILAALLVLLTGLSYWRGEPAWELDDVFVATNLVLLAVAFVGISFFSVFLDIFAAMGLVAVFFGLCRAYAKTQRGYAIGNDDYRQGFDPARHPWLALVRLRFVPDAHLDGAARERRLREFRRRLRRFMYHGTRAVALDCVVEYDTWLWESMKDVTVFMWGGTDPASVAASAREELAALRDYLRERDAMLDDDGSVRVAWVLSQTDAADDSAQTQTARARICTAVGRVLCASDEQPLVGHQAFMDRSGTTKPEAPAG